jgi:hypothetical protein
MTFDPSILARLTDSTPTPVEPVERLRKICAWCIDFDPRHPANRNATHVMCPACVHKVNAAMKVD